MPRRASTSSFLQAASRCGQGCSFPFALLLCWRLAATFPEPTCQPVPALLLTCAWQLLSGVPRARLCTEELPSPKAGVSHQIQQAGEGEGCG